MALQVEERLAGDRPNLGNLVAAQADRIAFVAERGDIVEV